MKQLLIVNSQKALNKNKSGADSVTPFNFSGLDEGAIAFAELPSVDESSPSLLSAAPTRNFCIALGRPNNQIPFVIPEVDLDSLSIIKAVPKAAVQCAITFTVPDPSDVATLVNPTSMVHSPIAEYGFAMIKKGAVPHERNRWSTMVASQSDSAATVAAALVKAVNDKTNELFPFEASADGAEITITCLNVGEDWTIRFTDCLDSLNAAINDPNNSDVEVVSGEKAMGDKADIQDLASRCAAGKGFTDTYRDGDTVYPGYPEVVEDTTYNVYTLRFRVGRDGAKTRDERVWQVVHIAVPVGATAASDIDTILTLPNDSPAVNGGTVSRNSGNAGSSDPESVTEPEDDNTPTTQP